ncbi:MAG: hypothetical protein QW056_06170 [Candidatus Bathyarchaeia archaeon]
MPAEGYKNFTIRRDAAEKLETYASLNGLKVVQLVNKLAEKLETDVPFMYLLKAVENARLFMLKEAVEAEVMRDLLVRLYLNLRSASVGLQSLLNPNVQLFSLSRIKSLVASIVNMIDYQVSRLEKILDEAYPKGWATPLPPIPVTYGFLLLQQTSPFENMEKIVKEQLISFLKNIQDQIDNSLEILEELKPYLPQLWESVSKALTQVILKLNEIRLKELGGN